MGISSVRLRVGVLALAVWCASLLCGCAGATRSDQIDRWIRATGGLHQGAETHRLRTVAGPIVRRYGGDPGKLFVLAGAAPGAWAWPDGRIFLSRGLMQLLLDDRELAAAVAHEVGHLLADGHLPPPASLRGPHSGDIDEEAKADGIGAELLRDCGEDPGAMRRMLMKVQPALPRDCRHALTRRIERLSP